MGGTEELRRGIVRVFCFVRQDLSKISQDEIKDYADYADSDWGYGWLVGLFGLTSGVCRCLTQ